MRYIICDTKLKPMSHFCAHDSVELVNGYCRDLETGAMYHDPYCLQQHRFACEKAIEHVA